MTDYTGLWKFIYDWQTLIAGALAILAAVIGGGMAYQAGRVQANATRRAADLQVAAMNAQLAHLKAEKNEADQRAESDQQIREISQINIAITGIGYNIETLLHTAHQYILPHHKESHLAYKALENASSDPQRQAELAMSISAYRALVTTCPEIHFIEWDFLKRRRSLLKKIPNY
jgi:hypothetical protein